MVSRKEGAAVSLKIEVRRLRRTKALETLLNATCLIFRSEAFRSTIYALRSKVWSSALALCARIALIFLDDYAQNMSAPKKGRIARSLAVTPID
jgi:hypothetical protein